MADEMDKLSDYLTCATEIINKNGGSARLSQYDNDDEWEAELRSLLSGSPTEVIEKVMAIVIHVRVDALEREWLGKELD